MGFISEKELAAQLGIATKTLSRLRRAGGAPPWLLLGNRVRYAQADVEAWLASRLRWTRERFVHAPAPGAEAEPR